MSAYRSSLPTILTKAKRGIGSCVTFANYEKYEQIDASVRQYWAFQIYNHNHRSLVQSTLKTRYEHAYKGIDNFVEPILNPLKRVANLKAQTYSRPPVRRSPNQQMQNLLNEAQHRVNRSLAKAARTLNATGNVCLWPVVGRMGNSPVAFNVLVFAPHECYLEPNFIDGKYDLVASYLDWYLVSYNDGASLEENGGRKNLIFHKSGKTDMIFQDVGNPVWCSLEETQFGKPRCIGPINDLITGTVSINQMEAFNERVTYLKSFKQATALGDEKVKTDQLIASPNTIWPNGVELVNLVDADGQFETLIERKVEQLAGQHGVSKLVITGDFQNEQTWASISEEMMFHFEDQLENWKGIEQELWKSTTGMEILGITGESVVVVRFVPPYKSSRDPQKEWELHRERVKHGYESTDEKIFEEHPEFHTIDDASTYRKDNLSVYSEEIKMKRALNIQDDGPSPAQNGALGAIEKAKQNGQLGASGPSVDGKEVESELINGGN